MGFSKTQLHAPLQALNKEHQGKLFSADKYRNEAWVIKHLEIFIRNTEYHSIDFTKLPLPIKNLCRLYRQAKNGGGLTLALPAPVPELQQARPASSSQQESCPESSPHSPKAALKPR
jgi:hypothetical protein